MNLSNEDKKTIAAVLRTQAELQDRRAMVGTNVLARLQLDEPENPLTLAMSEGVELIEDDCGNLLRIAGIIEADIE